MKKTYRLTIEAPFGSQLDNALTLKASDYVHPREVVQDDRLGPTEKRAILSAWASDASAVKSRPGFRWPRGTPGPILLDHVLAALRTLDEMTGLYSPREELGRQSGHRAYRHRLARFRGAPIVGGITA